MSLKQTTFIWLLLWVAMNITHSCIVPQDNSLLPYSKGIAFFFPFYTKQTVSSENQLPNLVKTVSAFLREKSSILKLFFISVPLFLLALTGSIVYLYPHALKKKPGRNNKKDIRNSVIKIESSEIKVKQNSYLINDFKLKTTEPKEAELLLREKEKTIDNLIQKNQTLVCENEKLQQKASEYAFFLQQQAKERDIFNDLSEENIYLREREVFLCNELLKKNRIVDDLKRDPKYLDALHWVEITEAVNPIFNGLTTRLLQDIPSLTESDLQICCLLKLHFTIPEIATILGISSTSVSKRKMRLKERIINHTGKPFGENQTVDNWLWDY